MKNRSFATRFGLVALMSLSLFASTTAFAGNTPAPTQVVVANTPAQPVPMVGLITDADNPARQFFQTNIVDINVNGGGMFYKITSAPAAQKLVIERVSGWCSAPVDFMFLRTLTPSPSVNHGDLLLPATFWNGSGPAYLPVRFYVKPGDDFGLFIDASSGGAICHLTVGGYYVN
jgi:hypothetical protein